MRILTTSVLIGSALAVTACAGPTSIHNNRTLYSQHQPVVERSNLVLDVAVNPNGTLPPNEQQRMAQWFQAMNLGYGDRVALDTGGARGLGGVKSMIEAQVAQYGLLVQDGAPVTADPINPGSARIVVSRSRASVPSCPDWSGQALTNLSNSAGTNYGCANNSNLAAMVADPEDLVRGQQSGDTTDPQTSNRAIRTYRDAEPTGAGGLPASGTANGAGGAGGGGGA